MEGNGRPNRSDIHISKEDEAKIEEETREYFNGLAPKRHTKPQRSEYSLQYVDSTDGSIPELTVFQKLEHDDNQKLDYKGGEVSSEEFTETEYYKDLNSIDKQHHTTGKGFIKTDNCNCFSLTPDPVTITCHPSCRGNPATNDWIPAEIDDKVSFASSDKPNRSEN
ncbi:uncharacterized protein LOC124912310 [Impatiens glandulifera]|uniref:uncharacterized protein LOC124912310 n=1 Tax=Impatiens glandulifera TaxID=253017 RepID=UPI001FB1985F|nr:uncharacterized protein LOC124912310 [Impatiens glandulifera]